MVKNLPSNRQDVGSVSGQETKILHAMQQIQTRTLTTKK